MNTDRTAAPARNTALAPPQPQQQPQRAGNKQGASGDVFSSLLSSVAPKADDPKAQPQPAKRPDRPDRPDHPHAGRRDDHAKAKDAAKPTDDTKPADPTDEPQDDDKATKPGRLVTPELFALQLASPLPTNPTPAADPNAAQAQAAPADAQAQAQAAQAVPGFAAAQAQAQAQVDPNAIAAQQAQDAVAAAPADEQATQAVPPAATPGTGTGGIPLSVLAGLTATPADQQVQVPDPAQAQQQQPPVDPNAAAPDPTQLAAPNPADLLTQAAAQPADTPAPQSLQQAQQQTTQDQAPTPPVTTNPIVTPPVAPPVVPLNTQTGLQRLVPMSRVPETTATMIHIAAERGVTHARLNLKPVELGGIEVRLRTTPQGISAHLVADSPEAAKLLNSAANDLRRDLEARDVNLLSLDVSTQGDQRNQGAQAGAFADEFREEQRYALGQRANGRQGDEGLTEPAPAAETNLVLPNGVLVDVLA